MVHFVFAQKEYIPIVFVDGKYASYISVYLGYYDTIISQYKEIELKYDISIDEFNKTNKLFYLLPDTSNITVHICHREFSKKDYVDYHYYNNYPKKIFKDDNIISIVNYNKKKGIYFFYLYFNQYYLQKWEWEKKFGNKYRAYKKFQNINKKLFFPRYIGKDVYYMP